METEEKITKVSTPSSTVIKNRLNVVTTTGVTLEKDVGDTGGLKKKI